MIHKNYHSLSFGSKVNLVYTNNDDFKEFFRSQETKKAVNELINNGNDDIVTLKPVIEHDMNCRIPCLQVRVINNKDGKTYLGTSCVMGAYPREITSEYKRAQVYKKEVPQSALSEFYI